MKSFHQQFDMKGLGSLRYFLGTEVAYCPVDVSCHKLKFVHDLWADIIDDNTVDSPLELNHKLITNDCLLLLDPAQDG